MVVASTTSQSKVVNNNYRIPICHVVIPSLSSNIQSYGLRRGVITAQIQSISNQDYNRNYVCLKTPSERKTHLQDLMKAYFQTTYDIAECNKRNY